MQKVSPKLPVTLHPIQAASIAVVAPRSHFLVRTGPVGYSQSRAGYLLWLQS